MLRYIVTESQNWIQSWLPIITIKQDKCRSQWPRGLRRGSAAARLLGLWVRILRRAWIFFCCEYCVLSGRGPCDELITRPEESYWLWCVVVCDIETSWMSRPCLTGGGGAVAPKERYIWTVRQKCVEILNFLGKIYIIMHGSINTKCIVNWFSSYFIAS
jgi:hypothetical protein